MCTSSSVHLHGSRNCHEAQLSTWQARVDDATAQHKDNLATHRAKKVRLVKKTLEKHLEKSEFRVYFDPAKKMEIHRKEVTKKLLAGQGNTATKNWLPALIDAKE